jgi:hypothetical protein
LLGGQVCKVACSDVILADVEGVKRLGEVLGLWQKLPVDTTYMEKTTKGGTINTEFRVGNLVKLLSPLLL